MGCIVARDLQQIIWAHDKSIANVLKLCKGFAMDFLKLWHIYYKYVAILQWICNGFFEYMQIPLQVCYKLVADLQWICKKPIANELKICNGM